MLGRMARTRHQDGARESRKAEPMHPGIITRSPVHSIKTSIYETSSSHGNSTTTTSSLKEEFMALVTTDDGGSGRDEFLIVFAMLRARLYVARKLLPMKRTLP